MTTTPPPMETLTELKMPELLKQFVNESYVPKDRPIIMAYVDSDGRPGISYRGSTIAYSDTQLAVWARRGDGGTATALATNPNVTLTYREPNPETGRSLAVITFRGKGRVADDEETKREVYNRMPEVERVADPEFKGTAIIIDLESITGFIPGYRLQMTK